MVILIGLIVLALFALLFGPQYWVRRTMAGSSLIGRTEPV